MIRKYQYGGPGYFLGGVTAKDLDEGTKKVARGFNWLVGKVGDTFNTVVTAGASSDFGQTSPFAQMNRKTIAKGREQVRQKAKKAIEENAVYISPSSHVAAWTQGSWNPKAANSRKWKHQSGGILEDRSAEKQKYDEWNQLSALDKLKRNFNIARQFISESPRLENVYNAAQAMLGEYNPQNPYLITGVAPSVGRTPKIRKQSVSDVNNKGLQITKKFNTSVKNGMTYEDGDIRHLNRGPRSHDAQARERARIFLVKYRSGTPEFKQFDKLTKTLAKRKDSGATNSVLNNIKKQMNSILDDLIDKGYVQ